MQKATYWSSFAIFKDPANAKNDKITLGRHEDRRTRRMARILCGHQEWIHGLNSVVGSHASRGRAPRTVLPRTEARFAFRPPHHPRAILSVTIFSESDVKVLFFPSHTTHFLQPLDNVCFARFKFEIAAGVRRLTFRDA